MTELGYQKREIKNIAKIKSQFVNLSVLTGDELTFSNKANM